MRPSDGNDRFNIPIPSPSLTPLSTLLATLSSQTGLPLDQLKLIYKGAVLKDPSLTLSSYGIDDGSTLVLIGKGGDVPAPTSTSNSTSTKPNGVGVPIKKKVVQPETDQESVLVEWINHLVDNLLQPLIPSILTFISQTHPNATNRPKVIPKFEVLQKEHARLSETLLKALLDLDGVNINNSEWNDARQARKMGVKQIQGELNRVDEAWGERKRIGG
uniref:Uncharacterized protein n=1 Tax=Kwoniella dejecticola CBS 10117 TaxID=1296121 RepID=A0A1A6A769_9TREE|nr:uncharacterized protein I303_03613 [Kwoniella dejecticola CBS 10117]OBR85898.1 hypothetical protein I303_03613 [Kwoniella dejecticola CBS 10117]